MGGPVFLSPSLEFRHPSFVYGLGGIFQAALRFVHEPGLLCLELCLNLSAHSVESHEVKPNHLIHTTLHLSGVFALCHGSPRFTRVGSLVKKFHSTPRHGRKKPALHRPRFPQAKTPIFSSGAPRRTYILYVTLKVLRGAAARVQSFYCSSEIFTTIDLGI